MPAETPRPERQPLHPAWNLVLTRRSPDVTVDHPTRVRDPVDFWHQRRQRVVRGLIGGCTFAVQQAGSSNDVRACAGREEILELWVRVLEKSKGGVQVFVAGPGATYSRQW